jgi:hypothetical protein
MSYKASVSLNIGASVSPEKSSEDFDREMKENGHSSICVRFGVPGMVGKVIPEMIEQHVQNKGGRTELIELLDEYAKMWLWHQLGVKHFPLDEDDVAHLRENGHEVEREDDDE